MWWTLLVGMGRFLTYRHIAGGVFQGPVYPRKFLGTIYHHGITIKIRMDTVRTCPCCNRVGARNGTCH